MILPQKQLSINESYFGLGTFLLEKLTEPISVEDLKEETSGALKFSALRRESLH